MTGALMVALLAAAELPRTKPLEQHPGIETVAGTVVAHHSESSVPSDWIEACAPGPNG